jgi:hypothetical protein
MGRHEPVSEPALAADAVFREVRSRPAAKGEVVDIVTASYDAHERALYSFALG